MSRVGCSIYLTQKSDFPVIIYTSVFPVADTTTAVAVTTTLVAVTTTSVAMTTNPVTVTTNLVTVTTTPVAVTTTSVAVTTPPMAVAVTTTLVAVRKIFYMTSTPVSGKPSSRLQVSVYPSSSYLYSPDN